MITYMILDVSLYMCSNHSISVTASEEDGKGVHRKKTLNDYVPHKHLVNASSQALLGSFV